MPLYMVASFANFFAARRLNAENGRTGRGARSGPTRGKGAYLRCSCAEKESRLEERLLAGVVHGVAGDRLGRLACSEGDLVALRIPQGPTTQRYRRAAAGDQVHGAVLVRLHRATDRVDELVVGAGAGAGDDRPVICTSGLVVGVGVLVVRGGVADRLAVRRRGGEALRSGVDLAVVEVGPGAARHAESLVSHRCCRT